MHSTKRVVVAFLAKAFYVCYTELVTPSNSLPFETERNWEFLSYLGASCADKPAYQEAFPERLCIGLAASLRQFLGSPMLFMGFVRFGAARGARPNPHFNTDAYRRVHMALTDFTNPLMHALLYRGVTVEKN